LLPFTILWLIDKQKENLIMRSSAGKYRHTQERIFFCCCDHRIQKGTSLERLGKDKEAVDVLDRTLEIDSNFKLSKEYRDIAVLALNKSAPIRQNGC
jgi:hypothetical protein